MHYITFQTNGVKYSLHFKGNLFCGLRNIEIFAAPENKRLLAPIDAKINNATPSMFERMALLIATVQNRLTAKQQKAAPKRGGRKRGEKQCRI